MLHRVYSMTIVKEIIAILCISFVGGLVFNAFSPNGINVLDNPWSRTSELNGSGEEDPVQFVDFDRACRFVENGEGIVLDARNPEDYAEGHIPGARLLFFYDMNDYYLELENHLRASPLLLTYCSNIDCEDSEFLANELLNLGHMSILVYKGGFEDWTSRQMSIEKEMEEIYE